MLFECSKKALKWPSLAEMHRNSTQNYGTSPIDASYHFFGLVLAGTCLESKNTEKMTKMSHMNDLIINTSNYEAQRRGPDHRSLHDILHQRGDLLTGQSS